MLIGIIFQIVKLAVIIAMVDGEFVLFCAIHGCVAGRRRIYSLVPVHVQDVVEFATNKVSVMISI